MGFVKLHAPTKIRLSLNSPAQRIRFSIHTRKTQRNLKFPLSSQPVGFISASSTRFLHEFKLCCRTGCFDESSELHFESVSQSSDDTDFDPQKNEGSNNPLSRPSASRLLRNAVWIGVATASSKILGLLREIILAAVFGVGPVATAFKHASVLPGFCVSLLGGVNGPIHVTMATTLSKLSKESGRKLIRNTNSVMFLIGGVSGALVFMFAESIIYVSAPGLWILADGRMTREIAISQLKLMIPCIVFAGPVGLGLGCLSAEGNNIFACISPALSSILIIASCVTYISFKGSNAFYPDEALFGAVLISCGASLGAFLQWLIQVIMHEETRYDSNSISRLNILKDKDVHEFFALMLPATLISGMAQIASFTDLYFASFIPNAAAGLSYAHLLAMAPLGILSSSIVLPLVPTYSKLAEPLSWPSLMENLKQAVLLCMVLVLPVTLTMCMLAEPIIKVLFQRFTFDSAASALVSSLFLCYSIGSPFYIIRELLVMVFYALGDGQQPSLVSVAAIILNAFLDWLFVSRFCLGAQGLALSTSFVTALSALVLLHLLLKKLTGQGDFMPLVGPLLPLLSCCIISGFTTSVAYKMMRFCRLSELLSISLAGSLGMCGFYFPFPFLHFPGSKLVEDFFKTFT